MPYHLQHRLPASVVVTRLTRARLLLRWPRNVAQLEERKDGGRVDHFLRKEIRRVVYVRGHHHHHHHHHLDDISNFNVYISIRYLILNLSYCSSDKISRHYKLLFTAVTSNCNKLHLQSNLPNTDIFVVVIIIIIIIIIIFK